MTALRPRYRVAAGSAAWSRRARGRSASAARCTSICCRRAMRAARRERTSRRWLAHMQAGEHELAWRALVADNPFAAIHGRVCYHPCESVCNRAKLDSAVSIHSVERFLGDLALERGWLFDPPRGAQRQAGARDRRGPERAVGCLSPGAARPRGRDPRCGRRAGRDDALRHPGLPDAPRRAQRRGRAASRRSACASPPITWSRTSRPSAARATSTPCSSRSARICRSGWRSPPWTRDRSWTRCRSCAGSPSGERPAIGRRVADLRRRQHGDGRRADGAPAGRRGDADRLPPHARADAGARGGGAGRRAGGGAAQLAAHDHDVRGPRAAGRGDGARRVRVPAADRAVRDARRGHRDPGARPGDRHRFPAYRAGGGVRPRRHRAGDRAR